MIAILLLGFASCANYTAFFEGNWNVTVSSVEDDGSEGEAKLYTIQFSGSDSPGAVIGDLVGEDEDGLAVTLNQIRIAPSGDSNTTFRLTIADADSEEPTDGVSFDLRGSSDGTASAIAHSDDGAATYVARIVGANEAQITVVNAENSVKIIRLLKEVRENKPSFISQMLFPMMMMLMMTFMKGNGVQQRQQPQQQANSK